MTRVPPRRCSWSSAFVSRGSPCAVSALVRDGEGAPGVERTTRVRYNQRFEVKHDAQRLGSVKVYGEDRLEMSLRGLPVEKRDEIYAKLKDLLAGL